MLRGSYRVAATRFAVHARIPRATASVRSGRLVGFVTFPASRFDSHGIAPMRTIRAMPIDVGRISCG